MTTLSVNRASRALLSLTLLLSLSGCATILSRSEPEIAPMHTINEFRDQRFAEVNDPFEGFNRGVYRFNYYFDKYVFLPVVNSYEFVTPVFVQKRVSGVYSNLGEVRNLTNSVFQLKPKESALTLGRFLTNSTVGLAGMFDPATKLGMPRRNQDFGKTLGYWGAASGPYLVLPIFGPSSLRDTGGLAVDYGISYGAYTAVDPFGNSSHQMALDAGVTVLGGIDLRQQQPFRYYESGYPFEYNMVRFLYHEQREIESGRAPATE